MPNSSRFRKTPIIFSMMIIATAQVGVSIYLPSLPLISEDLSVSQASTQNIVTLFLLGFGVSQLFYGPWSDAIGRRPVFLLGQGIYLLGTLLSFLLSDSFLALEGGRILQGLGAGSASVLGRSMLRDSYEGGQLTRALSYISIAASVTPILAPVIGGWIAYHFSWQWVFGFVLMYLSLIFVLGVSLLPETLPYAKKRFQPSTLVGTYWRLIRNPQVIGSAAFNWVSYLGSLVSLSVFPFFIQKQLGLSVADYATIMLFPSSGLMIGSLSLNILNRYLTTTALLKLSISLIFTASLWLFFTEMTVFNLVFSLSLLAISQGVSFPLSISLLLSPHKQNAGSVSALTGAIQMVGVGIIGSLLVEYWIINAWALGVFYLSIAIIMSCLLAWRYRYIQSQQ
ncbi:multidrug effflux MFS transporter [Vibrio sp.]|nr:multidrug effflux MFS transporter [Vibrio sp.]